MSIVRVPNRICSFKNFYRTTGIYIRTKEENDFILNVLNIKPLNKWNENSRINGPKRKWLIGFGVNDWKYFIVNKDDIVDLHDIHDFKKDLKDLLDVSKYL